MRVANTEIRQQVCQTLVTFYCKAPPKQDVQSK